MAETILFDNLKLSQFISMYNSKTDMPISENIIEKGNVQGKFHIYQENSEWTIYAYLEKHSSIPGISISVTTKEENLSTYFTTILSSLRDDLSKEEITDIWEYTKSLEDMDFMEKLELENEWRDYPTTIEGLSVNFSKLWAGNKYTISIHDQTYMLQMEE